MSLDTLSSKPTPQGFLLDWRGVLSRERLRVPLFGMVGLASGWNAFSGHWEFMGSSLEPAQFIAVSAVLLMFAWRMVTSRKQAFALMVGWYAGATLVVPAMWVQFFQSRAQGWLAMLLLSVVLAAPYVLSPRGRPRLGVIPGIVLSAVPPLGLVGLASPLLLAGAWLPGSGWWGMAVVLAVFALCAYEAKWAKLITVLVLFGGGLAASIPPKEPPARAWAATTYLGYYPSNLVKSFARQDQLKAEVLTALHQGAKLVVLPEGADPGWDNGQAFYWQSVAQAAKRHHAQVLLGVYSTLPNPLRAVDGLVDLGTGTIWHATITQPISMWRPWAKDYDFGPRAPQGLIPTPFGPAAYSICYEDILMWPLAWQELQGHPKLLISAANQWFANATLARPQTRSIQMQARLWGLPLLRAVNWKTLQ